MSDHERELTKGGREDAANLARALLEKDLVPSMVLASDSVRTRQTVAVLDGIWNDAGAPAPVARWESGLYVASPEDVLTIVMENGGREPAVMVVGHNPTLEELASQLSQTEIRLKTSSVAVFDFPNTDWKEIDTSEPVQPTDVVQVR